MFERVQDSIDECGVTDQLILVLNWELDSNQGKKHTISVVKDLQQIPSMLDLQG